MRIVMLGPPGVGKGTQGRKLAAEFSAAHISTGDMLRQTAREETPVALRIRAVLAEGRLVADELIIEMVEERLEKPDAASFVLDGFPRTIPQAEALDRFLSGQQQELTAVILLTASEEEIQSRLLARGKKDGRSDDNVETIVKRMGVYEEMTRPLVDFYEEQAKLIRVLSEGTIENVFSTIKGKLKVIR
ncbi:MAG: adenylate kinase [Planctomycetota bacterium]